jgi:hypothetical protein
MSGPISAAFCKSEFIKQSLNIFLIVRTKVVIGNSDVVTIWLKNVSVYIKQNQQYLN